MQSCFIKVLSLAFHKYGTENGVPVRRILVSFAVGILITCVPLALAIPFYSKDWFRLVVRVCDWPMLLVQRHFPQLVHGSELDRLIGFFLINVVTWFVLAILCTRASKAQFLTNSH